MPYECDIPNHYPPEQQTQEVAPYTPPLDDHYEEMHSLHPANARATQD